MPSTQGLTRTSSRAVGLTRYLPRKVGRYSAAHEPRLSRKLGPSATSVAALLSSGGQESSSTWLATALRGGSGMALLRIPSTGFLLCVLSYLLLCSCDFARAQEGTDGSSDEASGADHYAIAKQWEEYGKSMAAALSEEKTKSATLTLEVGSLKAKVASLETALGDKEQQLKSVKTELEGIESRGKDVKAQLQKALAKASESEALKAKVEELKERAEAAEKAAAVAEAQKKKLADVEAALSYAKKALLRAEEEAAEKARELQKVAGSVLPSWAKERLSQLQKKASVHWEEYGKPAVSSLQKKAAEGASAAHKWASPHIATVQSATVKVAGSAADALQPLTKFVKEQHEKLAPVVGKHMEKVHEKLEPHVKKVQSHVQEALNKASELLSPHVQKLSRFSEPYVEMVRAKSKGAYDAAYEVVGPHVEKMTKAVHPHAERVQRAAEAYHEQLRERVKATLETHSGLRDASPALVWYLASALVLLPILLGFVVGWPLFRGQKKGVKAKPAKSHHKRHHQRRTKRE